MANKKSTKRALMLSVVSLFICFTMLVGTTYAWFTDSVTSTGNIIKTGTLEVTLEYSAELPVAVDGKIEDATQWADASQVAIFDHDNWEPGYTEVRYVKVENEGSLDLRFVLTIVPNQQVADGEVDLADVIDVYIAKNVVAVDRALTGLTRVGTLADLIADPDGAAHGVLYAADEDNNTPVFEAYTIVLKMQETAGNEYQNISLGGGFSVNLLASQLASESDDIGTDYDTEATLPVVGSGAASTDDVDPLTGKLTVKLTNTDTTGANNVVYYGTLVIDAASLAPGAEEVVATVEKVAPYEGNITVADGEELVTYELKVEGVVNGVEEVEVYLHVGEDLNITGLYHYDTPITGFTYNEGTNGNIIFKTDSFSPFSIVVSDQPADDATDTNVPKADVTKTANPENIQYGWAEAGKELWGLQMVNANQKLDAAYVFTATHDATTVLDSKYAGWYCDYFVSVDKDVPAEGIILGGQYTMFLDAWVGFYSPVAVDANTVTPLISLLGDPWTYQKIVTDVGSFQCGVADVDADGNGIGDLKEAGAKFTVQLRLVDPDMVNVKNDGENGSGIWWENMTEGVHYIVVNTVVYDFATGTSTIDGVAQ